MGSILRNIKKNSVVRRGAYSLKKQKNWHYVGDGSNQPSPYPLSVGEPVNPSDFCHTEPNAILIP